MGLNLSVDDTKKCSYLSTSVIATSTSYIESGLSISLAANSTYHLTGNLITTANGDGMRFKFNYSGGSLVVNGMTVTETVAGTTNQFSENTEYTNTQIDEIVLFSGLVRTGSAGRLHISFRKNTDVTDDTPMIAGSHIVATLL